MRTDATPSFKAATQVVRRLHESRCDVDVALTDAGQPMASLESAIRHYCANHPNCADTVEGIRRWWLADLTVPLEQLEAVLERLVELGELESRVVPDGTTIYLHRA